jgi:hypothetical protein
MRFVPYLCLLAAGASIDIILRSENPYRWLLIPVTIGLICCAVVGFAYRLESPSDSDTEDEDDGWEDDGDPQPVLPLDFGEVRTEREKTVAR